MNNNDHFGQRNRSADSNAGSDKPSIFWHLQQQQNLQGQQQTQLQQRPPHYQQPSATLGSTVETQGTDQPQSPAPDGQAGLIDLVWKGMQKRGQTESVDVPCRRKRSKSTSDPFDDPSKFSGMDALYKSTDPSSAGEVSRNRLLFDDINEDGKINADSSMSTLDGLGDLYNQSDDQSFGSIHSAIFDDDDVDGTGADGTGAAKTKAVTSSIPKNAAYGGLWQQVDDCMDSAVVHRPPSPPSSLSFGPFNTLTSSRHAHQPESLSNYVAAAAGAAPEAVAMVASAPNPSASQSRKRQRSQSSDSAEHSDDGSSPARFRAFQSEQWNDRYKELVEFRNRFGHCLVPSSYLKHPTLFRWVKRQRYQYKLLNEGKQSTMTPGRINALNRIDFVWDTLSAQWEERLDELKVYRAQHGHCNVPSTYSANPKLAIWVKCQRRQYKKLCLDQPSNITPERIQKLNELGFVWEARTSHRGRDCEENK